MKTYVHIKTSRQMFIAALLIITKRCKQPKCPSTDEWMNKMWSVHAMEYYSAIKKIKVLIYATTWVNLENNVLSEKSQTWKATDCMIPFMWNAQNRQIHRESRLVVAGLGGGRWRENANEHGVSFWSNGCYGIGIGQWWRLHNLVNILKSTDCILLNGEFYVTWNFILC